MERENRYLVLKRSDIAHFLSADQKEELEAIINTINVYRLHARKKQPIEAVVVEHDWPEYETVWGLIEHRVDGETLSTEKLEGLEQLSSLARMGIAHKAFGNPIPHEVYDTIRRTEIAMVEFNQQIIRKAELFDMLRSLMGYVEDGSDVTLKLYQDDATCTFHVQPGSSPSEWGNSFSEAIQKAHKKYGDKDV